MTSFYNRILNKFPVERIKFAFAYGSGVFKQLNNDKPDKNMIDFVFVVDDSLKFHMENLKLNASHYSFLKHLGPYYLSKLQNEFGAGCYYNTLIPVKLVDDDGGGGGEKNDAQNIQLIKYGVMSEEALIRDLFDWDYLYMSGRLQKPVGILSLNCFIISNKIMK